MHQIENDSVGIVVTSPPYWNKADYGEYNGNIGGYQYYDDFLEELKKVFVECYWNVGRLIVEAQGGKEKAKYGNELTKKAASIFEVSLIEFH